MSFLLSPNFVYELVFLPILLMSSTYSFYPQQSYSVFFQDGLPVIVDFIIRIFDGLKFLLFCMKDTVEKFVFLNYFFSPFSLSFIGRVEAPGVYLRLYENEYFGNSVWIFC